MKIPCQFILAPTIACCVFALKPFVTNAQTNTVFYGPSAYLDFNGTKLGTGTNYSPFADMLFTYFYLETFEEGALTTPGVTNSAGQLWEPGIYTDSIDGDDGSIDGFGTPGHSWYVTSTNVTFTFSKGVLGDWPTHVGIVWTDVGVYSLTPWYGHVVFEAVAPDSTSLGGIGPIYVGDGNAGGQTAEDRFFGVSDSRGISAITITMPDSTDWEIDHLQYGRQATVVGQASPSIQLSPTNSGAVQISWASQSNVLYQFLWISELGTGTNVWRALGPWASDVDTNLVRNVGAAIIGNGSTNVISEAIEGRDKRFYRVVVVQ